MTLEIHRVTIEVTVETNKYTDRKKFEIHDLEEDLEDVKEHIEKHREQAGW